VIVAVTPLMMQSHRPPSGRNGRPLGYSDFLLHFVFILLPDYFGSCAALPAALQDFVPCSPRELHSPVLNPQRIRTLHHDYRVIDAGRQFKWLTDAVDERSAAIEAASKQGARWFLWCAVDSGDGFFKVHVGCWVCLSAALCRSLGNSAEDCRSFFHNPVLDAWMPRRNISQNGFRFGSRDWLAVAAIPVPGVDPEYSDKRFRDCGFSGER
jgi:hypothetical protein